MVSDVAAGSGLAAHATARTAFGGELVLVGDVEIALDAAFADNAGVLVLAGTGSNVATRGADGKLITAGGWGPTLADQGSGYSIGLRALRSLFLSLDEDRSTHLLQAVLDIWRLHSTAALVTYANALPAPDFSQLATVVLRCAESGDEVAMEVLQREGEQLGYLVRILLRRLVRADGNSGTLPSMAFAGSIMEQVIPVRQALITAVKYEFPAIHLLEGVVDPLQGALWSARSG